MNNLNVQQRLDAMDEGKYLMLPQNYHCEAFLRNKGVLISKSDGKSVNSVDLELITDEDILSWAIDPSEFDEHCKLAYEMFFDDLDEDTQCMVANGTGRFDLSTKPLF